MAPKAKQSPKNYEVLAQELRSRIMSGEFPEGTQLPGERELVLQTGRSRSSVREALRVLESEGLLSKKTVGRYGGSVVQRTPDHTIRRQLDLFIRGRSISFEDLLHTRQAIEPMLAQLAAANRTEEDLAEIRRRTIALEMAFPDRRHLITLLNLDWHIAVAAASHNELLNALMTGISGALKHASAIEDYGTDETCLGVIRAHRKILEAIERGDPAAARRRMERHLGAYEKELAEFSPPQLALS